MVTKYCDHGVYANTSEFTGSLSGATLTVSTVVSGVISLGASITGVGIVYPITIISYGTGSGGVGTYTVANHQINGTLALRTFYAANGGPTNTPVWGEPQEGDGTAITKATNSALVSVDMSSYVFSTSSVVSVMGVNVTCTAAATTASESATPNAQYSATLVTMINNLVTAINLHGGLVINRPAAFTQHKVRDSLFARRSGNSLELMTRSGSADWNGLTALLFTNVTNASSQTWSGGSGGCWGWLCNTGLIFPSAITYVGYGLWCPKGPLAGSEDPGDTIIVRSGKDIQMGVVLALANEFNPAAMGTQYNPVTFVIDDSTVWADGINPVLRIKNYPYASGTMGWSGANTGSFARIKAKRYSEADYGMVMEAYQASGQMALRLLTPTVLQFEGINFLAINTGLLQISRFTGGVTNSLFNYSQYLRCKFTQVSQAVTFIVPSTDQSRIDFIDSIFDCGSPSAPHTLGFIGKLTSTASRGNHNFFGCKFINFLTGSSLFVPGTPQSWQGVTYKFRNCDFGGITVLGPNNITIPNVIATDLSNMGLGNIATSQLGKRDFFIDTPQIWAAWVSTRSFPVLNAVLPNGIDKWSIQVIPTTVLGNIGSHCPAEVPRIVKIHTLPSSVCTLTIEVCIEQSLSWTKKDISLLVEYEDTSGQMQTIDSYSKEGDALTSSSALWNGVNDAPSFSNAGTLYFNRYKWVLTTPTAIKGIDGPGDVGTEIGCIVRIHTGVANANQMIFIDPEIGVI